MCSHNEWDPLEEVVIGVVSGSAVPPWHTAVRATMPQEHHAYLRERGGTPFPQDLIDAASRELDGLCAVLEREGVRVRRPSSMDHARAIQTPDWTSASGLYAAMPRDVLLVVGDEIIEAPMAWRCRLFENLAYRDLIKEYFRASARWTAAPRPAMSDELYSEDGAHAPHVVTEFEPVFDAADFLRFGADLVAQLSNVTNAFGIEWLRRHLGDAYRVHVLEFRDAHPMHIDATIMPLAAGRLLINPERVPEVPALFEGWEILPAPPPCGPRDMPIYLSSAWVSMNVLSLDDRRVIVEASETNMIEALAGWGFEPIPCAFRAFNAFGGSFHCASLDVRRRGRLETYF